MNALSTHKSIHCSKEELGTSILKNLGEIRKENNAGGNAAYLNKDYNQIIKCFEIQVD